VSAVASMLHYIGSLDLSSVFQKVSVKAEYKIGVQSGSNFQWGRLLANHVSAIWKCLQALLIVSALSQVKSLDELPSSQLASYRNTAVMEKPAVALDASMNALECVKGPALVVVMGVMELLIPKVWSGHESKCRQTLYAARNTVLESWRDHITFWPALEAYVKISFQPFLLFQSPQSPIHETLQELSSELMSLGESRLGVFNVLLAHCFRHWSQAVDGPNSQTAIESITTHLSLLEEGCIFGPLHKFGMKSLRYDGDIRSFVQTLGKDFPANEIPDRSDCYVRIYCVTLLLKLLVIHHQTEAIIWKLIDLFIQKDLEISRSKPLYHGNTLEHRIKHRLWEVILLLQNSCTDKGRIMWLFESAFDALVFDNQPSLRVMIECLLVRLLLQYPDQLLCSLWSHLEKDCGRRIGLVASLLTIIALTGCHLPTHQQKVAFFKTALPSVLSWVQTHHFTVRVHAQAALHKIWLHCKEQGLTELLDQHCIVEQCVHFSGLSNDAAKHKQRLLDNFIFAGLDPIKDFSVELIFHTLPRLTGITGEEWISPDSFTEVDSVFWSRQAPLPVMLPEGSRLRGCKPGLWVSMDKKHPATEELPNVDLYNPVIEVINAQSSRNLQKKIIPWETSLDFKTPDLPIRDLVGAERRQTYIDDRNEASLVLVASLIDKAPNLGGLCRTCEVFAVDTLVLGNTRIIEERMFQSLSVTAEKWLHILEVRPVHLATYLHSMRKKGYTILGVEQTANSKCLTEYSFSKRSLLLLGNEREGIPAKLLSLLDDCIEIPQLGIIRSLNVHVSGALLVWEYTQQWRKLGQQTDTKFK
jgi:tRNA G18 (ribose-2'-O)-methylase SpoU